YTVLLAGGMYFVMFRNIWGGFLGACGIRYLFSSKGRMSFIAVLALLSFGILINWELIRKADLYQDRISNTNNLYDRLAAWRYAFRAFSEHPLTGIGTGQITFYIRNAQNEGDDLLVMDTPAASHPHNSFIAQLAETGLLGAVPFFLVFWYFI